MVKNSAAVETDAHAIGVEYGAGHRFDNNWFVNSKRGGGLHVKDVKDFVSTGTLLVGNAAYAVGLNGTAANACNGVRVTGYASAGSQGYVKRFNHGCLNFNDTQLQKR